MHKEDCFFLGSIVKKHGYKGQLSAKLDTDEPGKYINLESVFVEKDKMLIPFFITESRLQKDFLQVKFEEVDDEETAQSLVGCELYLPLSFLPPLTGNQFYYHEVKGYTVIDKVKGIIGTVKEVSEHTAQALFVIVNNENKEILIPIEDHILSKVDRDSKSIEIDAPEGLIDLYLS